MNNMIRDITFLLLIAFVLLTFALSMDTLVIKVPNSAHSAPVETISQRQRLNGIAPKSLIIVDAYVKAGQHDALLINTVFTELRLYADEILVYEYGQAGTSALWFSDPPPLTQIVPLPETATNLRFEYLSPEYYHRTIISDIHAGSEGALLAYYIRQHSLFFILSLLFLLIGLIISVLSLFSWRNTKSLLQQGLFMLAIGSWCFGECDLSMFFFPYPAFLYFMTYIGLYCLPIPLLQYTIYALKPRDVLPLRIAIITLYFAICAAYVAQLMGLIKLHSVLAPFHVLIGLSIAVFVVTVVWEYYRYRNENSKKFILPIFILVGAALFELANYYYMAMENGFSAIIGTLILIISLGFDSVRNMIKLLRENDYFRNTNATLEEKINVDPLTGIFNRRHMEDNFGRIVKSLSHTQGALTIMMIDIDYFKKYNDTYGHGEGDICLKAIAKVLTESAKRADDFVARYGGEEFIAVFPNTDKAGAEIIGNKLLESVKELCIPHRKSDISEIVTVSIGAASTNVKPFDKYHNYIKRADEALYTSKNNGRNRYSHLTY